MRLAELASQTGYQKRRYYGGGKPSVANPRYFERQFIATHPNTHWVSDTAYKGYMKAGYTYASSDSRIDRHRVGYSVGRVTLRCRRSPTRFTGQSAITFSMTLWTHAVQPACPDQSVQQCTAFATVIGAEEQDVLSPQTDHPQGIFGDVVIRFRQVIFRIVRQREPLIKGICERFRQLGVARQRIHFLPQPTFQFIQQGFCSQLTLCQSLFCR